MNNNNNNMQFVKYARQVNQIYIAKFSNINNKFGAWNLNLNIAKKIQSKVFIMAIVSQVQLHGACGWIVTVEGDEP